MMDWQEREVEVGRWQSFVLGGECTLINSRLWLRMMIGGGYSSEGDCAECWK